MINAGPGAGKTRVLLTRAIHLIDQQGIKPWQILILAFNRAIVHEIRTRIKELFDKLGYGGYAAKIKVYTFHSYAISNLRKYAPEKIDHIDNDDTIEPDAKVEKKYRAFVELCLSDNAFVEAVAQDLKVLMVDEFQDMDDWRYELITTIHNVTGANLTVIGDDDQDILRWDRESKKEAIHYFEKFEQDFDCEILNLHTNFRSGSNIVMRSQDLLQKLLLKYSNRTKMNVVLSSKSDNPPGTVVDSLDKEMLCSVINEAQIKEESLAILCRTNQEALNIYQELKSNYPNISLQGQANVDLSWTRSVGSWIDCCQEYLNTFENGQYTKDIFDYICTNYSKSQIPEANDIHKPYDLEWLRKASMQENPYLTLIEHLSFLYDLKVEDYIRIYGRRQQRKQIIISTIHKVKGLEFDNVCVLSSKSKFQPDYNDVKRCVADEVRLYYVAITRAKQNIFFEWSEREKKWAKAESFNSNNNEQLSQFQGSPDEIFISWSGFDDSRQAYLEEKVRVGDQLLLSNKSILHNRTQIAKLKNNINVNDNIDLCIADVIRYPIAEDMPFYRNNPDIYKNIIPRCKERGWLYIPLISNT